MVTIEEARISAKTARSDIAGARATIATGASDIAQARSDLGKQEKYLKKSRVIPKAELYRRTGMAGVKSRRERESAIRKSLRGVAVAKTRVEGEEVLMAKSLEELRVSEKDVSAYETQIAEAEKAQVEYEIEKKAYDEALVEQQLEKKVYAEAVAKQQLEEKVYAEVPVRQEIAPTPTPIPTTIPTTSPIEYARTEVTSPLDKLKSEYQVELKSDNKYISTKQSEINKLEDKGKNIQGVINSFSDGDAPVVFNGKTYSSEKALKRERDRIDKQIDRNEDNIRDKRKEINREKGEYTADLRRVEAAISREKLTTVQYDKAWEQAVSAVERGISSKKITSSKYGGAVMAGLVKEYYGDIKSQIKEAEAKAKKIRVKAQKEHWEMGKLHKELVASGEVYTLKKPEVITMEEVAPSIVTPDAVPVGVPAITPAEDKGVWGTIDETIFKGFLPGGPSPVEVATGKTILEIGKDVGVGAYKKADVMLGGYLPGAVLTKEQKYREDIAGKELERLKSEKATIIKETKQKDIQYTLPTGEVVSGAEYRKEIEKDPYWSTEGMKAAAVAAAAQPMVTTMIEGVPTQLKAYEPVSAVGYIPVAKTFVGRVFERADVGWSERVLKPTYKKVGDITGLKVEQVGDLPAKVLEKGYEYTPGGQIIKYVAPEVHEKIKGGIGDITESFIESGLIKIRDKPITTTAEVGAWAAVGPALKGAGVVGGTLAKVTKVAKVPGYAKAVSVTGKAVTVGLGATYVGVVGARVKAAPEGARATEFGKILAEDVVPMIAGGYIGAGIVKGAGARKIRREYKERPIEEYVIPEVLSGKKTFPESPAYGYKGKVKRLTDAEKVLKQQFDVKVFREKGVAYHATGGQFYKPGKVIEIQKGKAELEGLYVAPSVSPYFLRTGKGYKLYGAPKKPGVLEITPEAFKVKRTTPTGVKTKAGRYEFAGELKPGEAYVTGVKPEIEAVIPYKTKTGLAVEKGKYYFEYKGQPVPIDVAKTVFGKKVTVKPSAVSEQFFKPSYSTSYAGVGAYPIVTPLAAGIGAAKISYKKPSRPKPKRKLTSVVPISRPISIEKPIVTPYIPAPIYYKPEPIVSEPSYKPILATPEPSYKLAPIIPSEPSPSKLLPEEPSYKPSPIAPAPSYKPVSPIIPSEPVPTPSYPYTPSPISPSKPSVTPSYVPTPTITPPSYKPIGEGALAAAILLPSKVKKKPKKVKKVVKKGQAYNAYAKIQKTRKWKKLNKVPLTKTRAKDYGSYLSDNTLSASYRIKPVKGAPQSGNLPIPVSYSSKTRKKFREYKIREGKKIPTPNSFIEKRNKRLDQRGETKKITLYKKLQELKKKSLAKPKTKKKVNKRSKFFGL